MADTPTTQRPFGSVATALVTPFGEDGKVDLDTAATLADHLVAHGHDALVLNGTTGESATTTDAEKNDIVRAVKQAVGGRAIVVAGAGSNDTEHSIAMAKGAARAGADGLLVVSPYYNRPSQEGLFAHFTAVANATELPVMLYDIPGRCGVAIGETTIYRLAENPRIQAVKDATGNVAAAFARMRNSGLAWYCGDDALNLAMLAQGASGLVSVVGHLAGARWRKVVQAVDAGDLITARDLHASALPAIEAIMGSGQGVAMVKAALEACGLLPNRAVRLPIVSASAAEADVVRTALAAANLDGVAA